MSYNRFRITDSISATNLHLQSVQTRELYRCRLDRELFDFGCPESVILNQLQVLFQWLAVDFVKGVTVFVFPYEPAVIATADAEVCGCTWTGKGLI